MEQVHLLGVGIAVLEEVDVHGEGYRRRPFLLPVLRDTSVEGHAVNPRLDVAAVLEPVESPPEVDKGFLEQVIHLVGIFGEHVAHGVDGALVVRDGLRKLFFFCCHCRSVQMILPV